MHKLLIRGQVIIQLAQICSSFLFESVGSHPHSIDPNLLLLSTDLLLLPADWSLVSALNHMNAKLKNLTKITQIKNWNCKTKITKWNCKIKLQTDIAKLKLKTKITKWKCKQLLLATAIVCNSYCHVCKRKDDWNWTETKLNWEELK